MSTSVTVLSGGGKYKVSIEKDEKGYALSIRTMEHEALVVLTFENMDQVTTFISDMTKAVLT